MTATIALTTIAQNTGHHEMLVRMIGVGIRLASFVLARFRDCLPDLSGNLMVVRGSERNQGPRTAPGGYLSQPQPGRRSGTRLSRIQRAAVGPAAVSAKAPSDAAPAALRARWC